MTAEHVYVDERVPAAGQAAVPLARAHQRADDAGLPAPARAPNAVGERAPHPSPRRVLLVGSAGGHLAQLVALEPWWRERERAWVTFDLPDAVSVLADEQVVWAHHPTTRNLPNLLRNLVMSWSVIRRIRPDLVVSSGAAVAFPYFLVAKLLRVRTVYIEVYDRIDSRTLSGRLCRPLSDLFCVQWEEQLTSYPGATVIGRLL